MTREIELSWAAGFFDGEGNTRFAIRKSRNNKPYAIFVVQISQTDPFALERFKLAVGAGHINGPYPGKTARHKRVWRYETTGDKAIEVFELIRPYLCIQKIVQGEEARQQFLINRKTP